MSRPPIPLREDEVALLVLWNETHRAFFAHLSACTECDPDHDGHDWKCQTADKLDNDQSLAAFHARKLIDRLEERMAQGAQEAPA